MLNEDDLLLKDIGEKFFSKNYKKGLYFFEKKVYTRSENNHALLYKAWKLHVCRLLRKGGRAWLKNCEEKESP